MKNCFWRHSPPALAVLLPVHRWRLQVEELDYLVEGLGACGASSRRSSSLRLLEACTSPDKRLLLRLSGKLPTIYHAIGDALCGAREGRTRDGVVSDVNHGSVLRVNKSAEVVKRRRVAED